MRFALAALLLVGCSKKAADAPSCDKVVERRP